MLEYAGAFTAIQVVGTEAFAVEVGGALFRSSAVGQPFVKKADNIAGPGVSTSFASLATDGDRFYAGGDQGGVWRSEDRGATWTRVGANSPVKISSNTLVVGLVPAQTLLLACTNTYGLYLSGDRGDKWVYAGQGLPIGNMRGLLVMGGKVLAGTFQGVYTRPLTDLPSSIRRAPALPRIAVVHSPLQALPRIAVVHSPLQALRLLALRADGKAMSQARN